MTDRILKADTLLSPTANDPQNLDDRLPMPYSMINQVLNETIMFQLNLKMHEIQKKKHDPNYEGSIRDYINQNVLDIEGISCLSQPTKTHNHLLAGDKSGNLYLLDLAKKAVFSKKQIVQGGRTLWITDSIITDGETSITTAAILYHNHPSIYIVRYKHSEPKLFLTHQIKLQQKEGKIANLPYHCEFHDHSRLLSVETYDGTIRCFRIPEVLLEIDKHTKASPIPLQEDQIKKILKYPLKMAIFESSTQIKEEVLTLKFEGMKPPTKYSDIRAKFFTKKKPIEPEQPGKKDPKKDKKVQVVEEPKSQIALIFNQPVDLKESETVNGLDQSPNYKLPEFQPFIYFINNHLGLPKTKYFDKSKTVSSLQTIIYGWKNTKIFKISEINQPNLSHMPQYLHLAYFQTRMAENQKQSLTQYHQKKLSILREEVYQNVHPITAHQLTETDQSLIAFGLKDGTVSVWNTLTKNLQFNTNKHSASVTCLKFFEKWKLISGSQTGQIFIHNVYSRDTEMKRTNTFESKNPISITSLQVNDLGVAYALDAESNLRVYDLWRNQKIAKFSPCNFHAILENKGERWLNTFWIRNNQTLYTNKDFTVIISTNWPNFNQRVEDRTPEQIQKMESLTKNPWKCKGTNVHIIRNFQYLLALFEGLQSIYKKGYERRRVENLFSNLEFSQLYDRTFEIPDFGKPQAQMSKKVSMTNNKSLFAGLKSSSKSLISSRSKQKSIKDTETSKGVKLTNQVLHPQKFLLERRKITKDLMVTTQSLVDWLRKDHSLKEVRQSKLATDNSKTIF